MASNWEKDLLDKGLQCSICMEFFNAPLTLPCSHTFCRVCLLQSTQLAPDGRACPQCRAPIQIKDPLRESANTAIEAQVQETVPADVLESRQQLDLKKLEELDVKQRSRLPIFSMAGAASRPGESVALHFFEPRYKILIRRAWEGNHSFLCTQSRPREGDTGLLVKVSSARFLADGRANIQGSGVQRVTLGRVWVEEGTDGLYYAEVPQGIADGAIPASDQVREQRTSSRGRVAPSQIRSALAAAIQVGAPAYNRGQVDVCAQTYARVAGELLEQDLNHAVASRLQSALNESRAAGRDWDTAAWTLRHAFDDILENRIDMRADTGSSLNGSAVEVKELPVFFMNSPSNAREGRAISLALFEPRYQVLAREAWASESRTFLYAVAGVETGASAMLVKLTTCSFDGSGQAHISGKSVAVLQLGAVRVDESKGDLYYAECSVPAHLSTSRRTAGGGKEQPQCCSVQ